MAPSIRGGSVLVLSRLHALRVSRTGMWGVGDGTRCDPALSSALQSHVLLWAHPAALPGEPGEGLVVLGLGSGELGKAEPSWRGEEREGLSRCCIAARSREPSSVELGRQRMLHCRAEMRSCANGDVLVSGRV